MLITKDVIVFQGNKSFEAVKNAVVTIGTFDGVHLGHKKIITSLIEKAIEVNGTSVLITFNPHPRQVINPDKNIELLTTNDEKRELLSKYGLDVLFEIPFTRDFSNLSAIDFIEEYLVKQIGAKKIIIGYDHHFGKDREGAFSLLKKNEKKFGFETFEIPAKDIDDVVVSSTKIRKALHIGDVKLTSNLLGYYYHLSGIVIKGNQLGKTIGFPTANIYCEENTKLIPANGVYAVRVSLDKNKINGVMNIGNRPTIEKDGERSIEVHLLDFDEDIYVKRLTVEFIDKIRDEMKFDGIETLKKQIATDVEFAKQILNNAK